MAGLVCLQGGNEFSRGCDEMDLALLEGAPGPVLVLALGAAPGRDFAQAQRNGARHFGALGAQVIDIPDPRENVQHARRAVERAGLVVIPGGSPARLLKGLQATGLGALLAARVADGCRVMGASAGAMVLCERMLMPEKGLALAEGLGIAPGLLVVPHWSGSRPDWEEAALSSGMTVLGIPEESGVVLEEGRVRAVGQHATRYVLERQDLPPGVSSGMLGVSTQGGRPVVTETVNETSEAVGAAPVSDRMQALLSRAVEEQVSEQRAVSTVLAELREQVATLEAGVRNAAANDTVAALGTSVSTVVADQRTATTLLSQRLEALTKRVEALTALAEQVAAQAQSLDRVRAELAQLATFPTALAALQRDVAGLHGRLAPLADVRAAVGDLGARTGTTLEALGPQLDALQAKIDALGTVPDPERFRDAVLDALSGRLERLQQAVDRPVVGPEALKSDLGDLRASLSAALGREIETLTGSITAVSRRMDQLDQAVSGASVGGEVSALGAELARVHTRLDEVTALRAQVERVAAEVTAARQEAVGAGVPSALEALASGLEQLSAKTAAPAGPSSDELSLAVSQRVADRLVETLAPRIADVVLTRVGAALVQQLGETLGSRLRAETEQVIAAQAAASEQRLGTRLDEGVMALAEALLRKKGGSAKTIASLLEEPPELAPVHEVLGALHAVPEPAPEPEPAAPAVPAAAAVPADERPAVTTGLAPAPAGRAPAPTPPAAEPAAAEPEPPTPEVTAAPLKPATRPRQAQAKKAPPAKKAAPARKATATKAAPVKKPAPVKKAAAPRPRPVAERRPAHEASDVAPVRPAPAHPTVGAPLPPPAPTPVPPLQRQPLPPPPPPPPPPAAKRKPWWRPSG